MSPKFIVIDTNIFISNAKFLITGDGNVYEAFQGFSASILKVLKPQWNSQPKAIELFKREYEVLAQLTKQGITAIPQALDYFEYQTRDGLKLYYIPFLFILELFGLSNLVKMGNI